jgi:hypothetical protein
MSSDALHYGRTHILMRQHCVTGSFGPLALVRDASMRAIPQESTMAATRTYNQPDIVLTHLLVQIVSDAILCLSGTQWLSQRCRVQRRVLTVKTNLPNPKVIYLHRRPASEVAILCLAFGVWRIQRTPSSPLHTLWRTHLHGKVDILCTKLYLSMYSLFRKCMELPLKRASLRRPSTHRPSLKPNL